MWEWRARKASPADTSSRGHSWSYIPVACKPAHESGRLHPWGLFLRATSRCWLAVIGRTVELGGCENECFSFYWSVESLLKWTRHDFICRYNYIHLENTFFFHHVLNIFASELELNCTQIPPLPLTSSVAQTNNRHTATSLGCTVDN